MDDIKTPVGWLGERWESGLRREVARITTMKALSRRGFQLFHNNNLRLMLVKNRTTSRCRILRDDAARRGENAARKSAKTAAARTR